MALLKSYVWIYATVSRSAKLSYITIVTIVSVRCKIVCDSCSYWLDICWPGTFKRDLVLLFCPGIFSFWPGNVLEIFCEICVDTLKLLSMRNFDFKDCRATCNTNLIPHFLRYWVKIYVKLLRAKETTTGIHCDSEYFVL